MPTITENQDFVMVEIRVEIEGEQRGGGKVWVVDGARSVLIYPQVDKWAALMRPE